MSIAQYAKALRRYWITILILFVMGAAVGIAINLIRPAEYTAETTMYVSARAQNSANAAYEGNLLAQQRIKSYSELAKSPRVTRAVIEQLNLGLRPEELAERISVSSGVESVVLTLAVTDRDAQVATAIANSLRDTFIKLVNELERNPGPGGGSQAVDVKTVEAAQVPDRPSSTGLWTTTAVGAILGLVVGFATALVRLVLDNSIRSSQDLTRLTSLPLLGSLPNDSAVRGSRPSAIISGTSSLAESVRQIRTNLSFFDVDNLRRVIVCTSPNQAEGKTTLIASLASAISASGYSVIVVDADLRKPMLAKTFSVDNSVGLTSVLAKRASLTDAVSDVEPEHVRLLAAGPTPPNPSELLASDQMKHVVDELRRSYDYVLVDSPPLLPVTDAAAMSAIADGYVIACRWGKTTVSQIESTVSALNAVSARIFGFVLTMSPARRGGQYGGYTSSGAGVKPERHRLVLEDQATTTQFRADHVPARQRTSSSRKH